MKSETLELVEFGTPICADFCLVRGSCGTIWYDAQTCSRPEFNGSKQFVAEQVAIAMGRSFENRKASIFKTAGQKSKLYAKYGKQLYVVAKNGVPDPETNPALRSLIERAKRDQVPSHVIEKAIEKAKGGSGEDFVAARYEGFGPGGCSVIIDCLTDNNNRTITDVRSCFTRTGSKLGPSGSVAHAFDHLAVLSFKGDHADQVLEAMLDADVNVDDVECKDGNVTLFAPATEFYKAKTALLKAFPEVELQVQEITFHPQADKEISAEDQVMFEKFINLLNDCDDVQDIYHNAIMPT
ncbi:MAG: YebC/PmpR family DNA-binding transcriptional regulator [Planctomycetales bacterium]|nr:YebC/PmpR family DNA-binding transcriptional regulator [Planctomycetales bacterium]